MLRQSIIFLFLAIYTQCLFAYPDSARVYTEQRPLVFEDSRNLWPYSYIDENGEPKGYCVDLVKLIMHELNIPYIIKLKQHQDVLYDLKEGRADLVLGLSDVYGIQFGLSGHSCVALLTQSVVTPKKNPIAIRKFRDLKNHQIITKDSGMCHQLMVDYGWGDNVVRSNDITEDILKMGKTEEGQIVWNTLCLQWLIEHYKLDNLMLTPVNMPYGERKFMSNDQHLLDLIDRTYSNLCASDRLRPLEEKRFYHNQDDCGPNMWYWLLAIVSTLLIIVTIIYFVHELRQNRSSSDSYHRITSQLFKLAVRNKVRFWAYNVQEQRFNWLDDNGHTFSSYSADQFAKRYTEEDFRLLKEALDRIINQQKDSKGHSVKEETLELRAVDAECGDKESHGFVVHLSVLSCDSEGKPAVIIGTKRDVTKERRLKSVNTEHALRYLSMFYNNDSGIAFFDKNGSLVNGNVKVSELLQCNMDQAVMKHININKMFGTSFSDMEECDGKEGQQTVNGTTFKYKMKTVRNDDQQLIGIFVFCI